MINNQKIVCPTCGKQDTWQAENKFRQSAGLTPVTLRIVLVKTPGGKNEAEAFFSTDINFCK